ncbi:ParB/RepB/Spo0J family partition protein [Usitatibacter palustris]|uniref:Putative chromosome-partitioning protein ParB n=1 Tax=Usitatibacter palustris TaxID=2732487 RepID=A0A6M4HG03_9PROT|nr:ParB/RepB/Spo0J family partition protein [Usitatibacter palustris]QJR16967.1 putative chromosome-partitioning protein ParB [Usitatibacter palustris]
MTKHRGLGRGLDALLGANQKPKGEEELAQLPVTALKPGKFQPRTRMDDASLAELAESIKARGVIQPIIVRPVDDSQYEILAGERRWRAARIAGLERVPAIVRSVSDDAALGIGLIENIQREDLSPIEEAKGLRRLIDEFHITHEEAARAVGRSRAAVTNLLRLLELAAAVQEMVLDGRLDMGHARALLSLGKARQVELAERIIALGLSVRDAERLAQDAGAAPKAGAKPGRAKLDADSRRLQEELSEALGATVALKPRRGGRGSVVIDYTNLDQLQGLVQRLKRR